MNPIRVYTTRICPYCVMAKRLLSQRGLSYEEVPVDGNDALRIEMMRRTGRRTVPQIFIGDHHVGGFEDLAEVDRRGGLPALLDDTPPRSEPEAGS